LLSLALSFSALAAPRSKVAGCDISEAKIDLPTNQTTLAPPKEQPSFIGVGVGTQNYTCGANGQYTNIGAVAELFDISCLYGTPAFGVIQDPLFDEWKNAPASVTPQIIISFLHPTKTPVILGQHYFIKNPVNETAGVSPKFDFTSQGANAGDFEAFVVAALAIGLPAPTGPQDVAWVRLTNVEGDLAQEVYRVDTRGGQPPPSCTPGSADITVKYAAKYWFFGGTVARKD